MNLDPLSPISGKPLSKCGDSELNAWCATLLGIPVYAEERSYGIQYRLNRHTWEPTVSVPHYGTSWADSAPLMERGEWLPQYSVARMYSGCVAVFYKEVESDIDRNVSTATGPAAIRNAFIVAAKHEKDTGKEVERPKVIIPIIEGNTFYCKCGSNKFTTIDDTYCKCNGCGMRYAMVPLNKMTECEYAYSRDAATATGMYDHY